MWRSAAPLGQGADWKSASEKAQLERSEFAVNREPDWLVAFCLGLIAASLGGVVWGALAAASELIYRVSAIFLGLFIVAVVRHGAKHVTDGVMWLAIFFTVLGVFVGDVVGLTLAVNQAGYPISGLEMILAYPYVFALAPIEVLIAYLFGGIGAVVGGAVLPRVTRGWTGSRPKSSSPPRLAQVPARGPLLAVQTITRSNALAHGRIDWIHSPPHVVEASYEARSGTVEVLVDGRRIKKSHMWGMQKFVDVPLSRTPLHILSLRFYGRDPPRIDVSVDGALETTI